MKKVALLISFMLVFALTSFAQADVTFEGSSELIFGIGLDDPIATGFKNDNDVKLSFTLGEGTEEKGAEEDVYGYISFGDWQINYNTDDAAWDIKAGDVTAKIMFPGGWFQVSGPNKDLNFIEVVQDDDSDNDNADKGLNSDLDGSQGFVLGLDFAPLSVEVGGFSEFDWESNSAHAYGFSLKASADIAPITVEAGYLMGFNYIAGDLIGVGGKVTADLSPLTVYVGGDVKVPEGGDLLYEVGGGVSVAVLDGFDLAADVTKGVDDIDDFDVRFTATEDGAGGIVPSLGIALTVELFNILGGTADATANFADGDEDMEYAVNVDIDYMIMDVIKPYATVRYGTFSHDDDEDEYTYFLTGQEQLKLNVGVELTMFTNVTLAVDYNSDDIISDAKSNGVVSLKAKVAY